MENTADTLLNRVSDNCQSWVSSGESLIAQHPHQERSLHKNEFVAFVLSYSNVFMSDGKVSFKFRAGQR